LCDYCFKYEQNGNFTYSTPAGYNDNDYQKLIAFFTQNENNITVIEKLGWDLKTPETWGNESSYLFLENEWIPYWSLNIKWNDDAEKRVTAVYLREYNLLGDLDVSNFTALTSLIVCDNKLTNLNVSGCIALEVLWCNQNNLSSLDVSSCIALENLLCFENNLTNLDVSKNTALKTLWCHDNILTNLDVSNNILLEELICNDNALTTLNVSGITSLERLDCYNNKLITLDVSSCTALESLSCGGNNLINLDVSKNIALDWLSCGNNNLTILDISKNTALERLQCSYNNLTNLDVSNNTALEWLICDWNNLLSIDVSKNVMLERLSLQGSNLTNIDVSNNIELTFIMVDNNNLTSLKFLENLQNLKRVGAYYNYLDLSNADVRASIAKIQATVDYNIENNLDDFDSWWGVGFYYQEQKTNCSHDYGSWIITKPATTTAAGERERICETCTHIEKGTIAKLPSGGNTGGNAGGNSGGGGGSGGSTTPTDTTTTTTPPVQQATGTSTLIVNIPRAVIHAINDNIPVNQLKVSTAGNVSVSVGTDLAEQNAVLVKYNAETQQLEFVSASTVGTNGNASMNITQVGDFLVLTFKTGDITGTGEVQTADALALLRHIAGISELNSIQQYVANGKSGDVGTNDALNILRYVAGVIDKI